MQWVSGTPRFDIRCSNITSRQSPHACRLLPYTVITLITVDVCSDEGTSMETDPNEVFPTALAHRAQSRLATRISWCVKVELATAGSGRIAIAWGNNGPAR
jgi:hypothetical protein